MWGFPDSAQVCKPKQYSSRNLIDDAYDWNFLLGLFFYTLLCMSYNTLSTKSFRLLCIFLPVSILTRLLLFSSFINITKLKLNIILIIIIRQITSYWTFCQSRSTVEKNNRWSHLICGILLMIRILMLTVTLLDYAFMTRALRHDIISVYNQKAW